MHTVCFNAHIRGASHETTGTVCQDYSGTREVAGTRGTGSVAVVADGHGDQTCRRSDRGSKIAVSVVLDYMESIAKAYVDADDESWRGMNASLLGEGSYKNMRSIAVNIVNAWRDAIYADYESDPIEELTEALEKSDKEHREKAVRRLYGTTVVFALALPDLCIIGQQGDGCVTAILSSGTNPLARADIMPEDPLCIGNITTSLSDKDAPDRMRVIALDGEKYPMAAVFVGTDGVDKSLPGEDGVSNLFSGIALDVLTRCERDEYTTNSFSGDLAGLLDEVSQTGSGDDASIAGIVDIDLLDTAANALRAERSQFDLRTSIASNNAKLASMSRRYEYYRTFVPSSEQEAEERDQYLRSYDILQKKVESAKRDLGMVITSGTGSNDGGEGNDFHRENIVQNKSSEDMGAPQSRSSYQSDANAKNEISDVMLEETGADVSIETREYENDASLVDEATTMPFDELGEREGRGLFSWLEDAAQTIPMWFLILLLLALLACCVILFTHILNNH